MPLQDGLYDLLLTESLERLLAGVSTVQREVQPLAGGASGYLVDSLVRQLTNLLEDLPGDGTEQAGRQLALVNELLVWLRQRLHEAAVARADGSADSIDLIAPPPRLLRAVNRQPHFPTPPELGLAVAWLFTAGKGSPSLLQEIRRELASSDRVDILVSFITVSGVRKLQDVLHQITARGGEGGPPIGASSAPLAHSHHHLYGRHRGPCTGRTGATAGLRSPCLAGWPAHAAAR